MDFQLRRVVYYRNSFPPILKGSIRSSESGCKIEVEMRPKSFVVALMICWTCIAAVFSGVCIYIIVTTRFRGELIAPFFFVLLGLLIPHVVFRVTAKKDENRLRELLLKPSRLSPRVTTQQSN